MKRLTLLMFIFLLPSIASSQWKIVKKMLNPKAKITLETEVQLKIELDGATLNMLISQDPNDPDADIAVRFEQRLSSNPYKVYFVTDKLRNDKTRPKSVWTKFFKTRFLSILRKK